MKTSLLRTALAALAAVALSAFGAVAHAKDVAVDAGKRALAVAYVASAVTLRDFGRIVSFHAGDFLSRTGLMAHVVYRGEVFAGVKQRRNTPIVADGNDFTIPFTLPAAALLVNDVILLGEIPAGVDVLDYDLIFDDADTNAAPTLAFTLGTANAGLTDITGVWKAAITAAQTGGVQRMDTAAPYVESNAAARVVGLKCTTAAATYAPSKKGLLRLKIAHV